MKTPAPPGKIVSVTYKLRKSVYTAILDNGFSIGYVNIDLKADQDEDQNSFSTKGTKKYPCLMEPLGLQVTLLAEGKKGDFWNLEIEIDGVPAEKSPIWVFTDEQGHLDYDKLIS